LEGSTSITLVPAATIGQLNLLSGIVSLVISASGLLDQAVVLIEGLEPPLRAPASLDYAPIVAASSVDYTPSSAAQGVDYAPGTAAQSTDYAPGKAAQPSDYIPITRRKG